MDLDELSQAVFARHVGDVFEVDLQHPATVHFELIESTLMESEDSLHGSFSVVFQGPREPELDQGTYAVRHDTLGVHPIFLVPVGRRADGTLYEAVFTRMP